MTGRLQFQNQDGSIHEKDFKHDDEIGGVSGIWEILRHDDEVAVTGKKSIKELVIGSMKVGLRWVLGNRSKLAEDFIWPHGGRIGTRKQVRKTGYFSFILLLNRCEHLFLSFLQYKNPSFSS